MKYRLILTKRFEKDVKRCVKRGKCSVNAVLCA